MMVIVYQIENQQFFWNILEYDLESNDCMLYFCALCGHPMFGSSGLEDQLLGLVVAEERPDLEEAKNQLIISNAKMKQELKEIEDEILFLLSSTEGNPVDNEELIQVLEASKVKAGEIKVRQWKLFLLISYVGWC